MRVPASMKVAVRPIFYGLETVTLTKRGVKDGGGRVEDVTILVIVTRMDKIRNEYIGGTEQVGRFGEKTREARLRWFGHVLRKEDWYIGR